MISSIALRNALVPLAALVALAGCENLPDQLRPTSSEEAAPLQNSSLSLEEREVEAPDVFSITDEALWDGRPSFGGVWVAYPGNTQPERVSIRNTANGKNVVGALFKREADNPGPKMTVSSDAAAALGIVPGTPTTLAVVALRTEAIATTTPVLTEVTDTEVAASVLPPVAGETPAADATDDSALTTSIGAAIADTAPATAPAPAASPAADAPSKPYIQVGTFSSQKNADVLIRKLEAAGVSATSASDKMNNGKTLYRVLAGPAASQQALQDISTKVAELGYNDAFPVQK